MSNSIIADAYEISSKLECISAQVHSIALAADNESAVLPRDRIVLALYGVMDNLNDLIPEVDKLAVKHPKQKEEEPKNKIRELIRAGKNVHITKNGDGYTITEVAGE